MSTVTGKELKETFVKKLAEAITKGVYDPKSEDYVTAPAAYFTVALQYLEKTGQLTQEERPSIASIAKKLSLPFSDGTINVDPPGPAH